MPITITLIKVTI